MSGAVWVLFAAIAVALIVIDVRRVPGRPRRMSDAEFDQAFRQMVRDVRGAG